MIRSTLSMLRRTGWSPRGEWTKAALAYFAAVAFGIAQPVYDVAVQYRRLMDLGFGDGFALVTVFHAGPTMVLLLARIVLWPVRRSFDVLVCAGTGVVVVRLVQVAYAPTGTMALPVWSKLLIIATISVLVFAAVLGLRRYLLTYMAYLGILSIYFPAQFLLAYVPGPMAAATAAMSELRRPDQTIFVFVFDEVSLEILLSPTGLIDEAAFPSLHRFAGDSVWFREAVSNYPNTRLSIPSLLSGSFLAPEIPTGLFDLTATPSPNLLSVLARRGYRVNVYSSVFGCVPGLVHCVRYYDGSRIEVLGRVANSTARGYIPTTVGVRLAWALWVYPKLVEGRFLATLAASRFAAPGEASVFHLMVSHTPWLLAPDGSVSDTPGDYHFTSYTDAGPTLRRYREQMSYLDRQFGLFLDGLKASGAWERSVIVVTSDHGTCWTPGCTGRVGIQAVEPSLARVPMMIHAPFLAPSISDDDYQHIDFRATLLDVLGLGGEGGDTAGRSALRRDLPPRPRWFVVGGQRIDLGLPVRRVELTPPAKPGATGSGEPAPWRPSATLAVTER